jgi:hypothetical protein
MKITSIIKTLTWIFIPVILLGGIFSFRKESGGHPGTTRAPSEPSCAYSGCHNGPAINGNNTVSTFTFSDPDTTYMPGQTYSISLTMNKAGIDKFGFEIVPIRDCTETHIGEWFITDSARTHQIYAWIGGQQRWYVTHSVDGSVPSTTGTITWNFNWIAPNFDAGDITFYYGMNCANNDGTPNGDEIHTNSFTIHPAPGAGTNEIILNESLKAWPDNDKLKIEFELKHRASIVFELHDAAGKIILRHKKTFDEGRQSEHILMPESVKRGVYFLNLTIDRKQRLTKKIVW